MTQTLNYLHSEDRREAFRREYDGTDCRYCPGQYEATITAWGLEVTCPNCGDTFEVEPCEDEAEQRLRY